MNLPPMSNAEKSERENNSAKFLEDMLDQRRISISTVASYATMEKMWPTSAGARQVCRKRGVEVQNAIQHRKHRK